MLVMAVNQSLRVQLKKYYYKAKVADSKYKELLISSREGLNITSDDLKKIEVVHLFILSLFYCYRNFNYRKSMFLI